MASNGWRVQVEGIHRRRNVSTVTLLESVSLNTLTCCVVCLAFEETRLVHDRHKCSGAGRRLIQGQQSLLLHYETSHEGIKARSMYRHDQSRLKKKKKTLGTLARRPSYTPSRAPPFETNAHITSAPSPPEPSIMQTLIDSR